MRAALLLATGLCLIGAACATAGHRPVGTRAAHMERLYFGRNIGDTAMVSDTAWATFVRDVLTPNFPEGATVWDAAGKWRAPDGTQVSEKSFVVELVHLVTENTEQRVQQVMETYKYRFAQQAVLRIVTPVFVSF